MRPTALGVKALAFWSVLLGAFFATPYLNLFFLLLTFLTVLGLLCPWWSWRNLAGLSGSVAAVELGPAGRERPVRVVLRAASRTRHMLRCRLEVEGRGWIEVARIPVLSAGAELVVEGRVPALPRGVLGVRRAEVVSEFPLGWFRARVSVAPPPAPIVTHPAPATSADAESGARAAVAGELEPGVAAACAPRELREHRPGDELRTVDWRASARRDRLVVREPDEMGERARDVVLDRRALPPVLEEALSRVAALALRARERGESLTLRTQGLEATYGEGARGFDELLEYLAAATPLPRDAEDPGGSRFAHAAAVIRWQPQGDGSG